MKQSGIVLLLMMMCIPVYSMNRSLPLRRCFENGPFSIEEHMKQREIMWRAVLAAADHNPQHLEYVLQEYNININEHGQGERFISEALIKGNYLRAHHLLKAGANTPSVKILACFDKLVKAEDNPKGPASCAVQELLSRFVHEESSESDERIDDESQEVDLD